MEKSIKLISILEEKAILEREGVQLLKSVKQPISVVWIIGEPGTGKSFFLNSLVEKGSFLIGGKDPCTKGVWIWGKPILAEDEEGQLTNVIMIDSEGFHLDSKQVNPLTIFPLLFSTCLLYNSRGQITLETLKSLTQLGNLSQQLHQHQFMSTQPHFHWLLRDFNQKTTNELGIAITSDEYMEQCLYNAKERLKMDVGQNLNSFFSERRCHMFESPFNSKGEQNPGFVKQTIEFRKIFHGVKSFKINGSLLVEAMQTYAHAINHHRSLKDALEEAKSCHFRLQCLLHIQQKIQACESQLSVRQIIQSQCPSFRERISCPQQREMFQKNIRQLVEGQTINKITPKSSTQSQKKLRRMEKNPSRKSRLSVNLNEFDHFQEKQGQNQSKSNIENETKIYRLTLELEGCKHELNEIKIQKKHLQNEISEIEDKKCLQIKDSLEKQRRYVDEIMDLKQKNQEARKTYVLKVSELEKMAQLAQQKVQYLQMKLKQQQAQKKESIKQIEEIYRDKLNYLSKQLEQQTGKHDQQLKQLKSIYKKDEDELTHSIELNKQRFYEELKDQISMIEKLKSQNQQLKISQQKLSEEIKQQAEGIKDLEQLKRVQVNSLNKKLKDIEEQKQQILLEKLKTKEDIISELETTISQLRKDGEANLQEILTKEDKYSNEINELESQYSEQIVRLKKQILQINDELEKMKKNLKEKERLVEILKGRNQQYINKIQKNQKQILLLESEFKQVQRNNHLTTEQREKKIEELQIEILNLQSEFKRQQEQKNNKIQSYTDLLKTEKERYEQKKQSLQLEVQGKKMIQMQVKKLKFQNEKNAQDYKYRVQILQEEKQKLSDQVNYFQSEKQGLQRENKQLTQIINSLNKNIDNNYANIHNYIQTYTQNQQNKIEQLLNKLADKEKKIYFMEQTLERIKCQNEHSKAIEKEQIQDLIRVHDLKVEKLQEEVSKMREVNNCLRDQEYQKNKQASLQLQRAQFEKQLQARQFIDKQNELQRQITQTKERFRILEAEIKENENEIKSKSQLINIFQQDRKATIRNIEQIQDETKKNIQKYEQNMMIMRRQYLKCEKENEMLRAGIKKQQEQYNRLSEIKNVLDKTYQRDYEVWSHKLAHYKNMLGEKK